MLKKNKPKKERKNYDVLIYTFIFLKFLVKRPSLAVAV